MRLIDADYYCKVNGCSPPYGDVLECANCCICDCPTIEAEPVRHGYWKHETKENVWGNMVKIRRCSECGKYSYKNKAFEFDFPNCPCCRAIMDKEV